VYVFVYGTLTDSETAAAVLQHWSFCGTAVLEGLHVVEGDYPTLGPGGRTQGRLLETAEVDRLDAYEGVDRGLYVRVTVPHTGDGPDEVAVYVGDPDRLDAGVVWPGSGPFAERVRTYLADAEVRVRPDRA
jgi:gamma-glutamylcyclotransferase (GGCT)/AIG2-like uncharacterized protein YtfP